MLNFHRKYFSRKLKRIKFQNFPPSTSDDDDTNDDDDGDDDDHEQTTSDDADSHDDNDGDDEQTTSDDAMLSQNSYDQRPQLYRSVGRCKKRGSFVFVRSTSRALITG